MSQHNQNGFHDEFHNRFRTGGQSPVTNGYATAGVNTGVNAGANANPVPRSATMPTQQPAESAFLTQQLQRLDECLIRLMSRIEPIVVNFWPVELFTRVPSESELLQRWNNTFGALELNDFTVLYEAQSPSAWRARRHYKLKQTIHHFDFLLPQIGNYLNHSFDANPPQDAALWHCDLVAFFASTYRWIHCQTTQMACEIDFALTDLKARTPQGTPQETLPQKEK